MMDVNDSFWDILWDLNYQTVDKMLGGLTEERRQDLEAVLSPEALYDIVAQSTVEGRKAALQRFLQSGALSYKELLDTAMAKLHMEDVEVERDYMAFLHKHQGTYLAAKKVVEEKKATAARTLSLYAQILHNIQRPSVTEPSVVLLPLPAPSSDLIAAFRGDPVCVPATCRTPLLGDLDDASETEAA